MNSTARLSPSRDSSWFNYFSNALVWPRVERADARGSIPERVTVALHHVDRRRCEIP